MEKEEQTILSIMVKKYQTEFDVANIDKKIEMFKEARDDFQASGTLSDDSLEFTRKNWQHLVHLIHDMETGLKICEALDIDDPNSLWGTVAALRTIEVVCKNKNVAETADLYAILAERFKSELRDPIRIKLAEIILKKMEQ
jgi:hypothetical protein